MTKLGETPVWPLEGSVWFVQHRTLEVKNGLSGTGSKGIPTSPKAFCSLPGSFSVSRHWRYG